MTGRVARFVLVVLCAVAAQYVCMIVTAAAVPLDTASYGLPLPIGGVGTTPVETLLLGFALDAVITVIALTIVDRVAGPLGVLAATAAVIVMLIATSIMWQDLPGGLGFAGFPVPLTTARRSVSPELLLLNCVLIGALATLAAAWLRRRADQAS